MPEKPPAILVVDDREENRYVSSRILRNAGYSVIEAGSGREALELVLRSPALVILDVRLPDLLGYEVCHRIKSNPQTANIPVLQVSAAFTSSESRVQALESGADAYLTQPLEPTVLVATVRALLRLSAAEAVSRLSSRQWQATFDALGDGLALLDSKCCVLRCNRAMADLLGKTYGEIERHDALELLREQLDLDLRAEADLSQFARDIVADRRWFSVRLNAVRDDNSLLGFVLVITEITDRKVAEDALRAAEKLAATGRLANSIAHEINNPLEAVTNLLYLLRASVKDDESMSYVEMANEELERVGRITRQTLAFNRESSQPIEVRIPELLDGIVTLYTPQFNGKGISVVRRYECSTNVTGFPGELRQVFSNLLRNALEAIPAAGRIVVHAYDSLDWKDMSRSGVRIVVFDSGSGIPEHAKKHLFEAFFTTKQLRGSGLGLWLTLGMVAKHQGSITFRTCTKAGRSGTCFAVFLPAISARERWEWPEREKALA